MDMLYSRYAQPMDLMNSYINRGRFGEFVRSFLEAEYERQKEQMEKENDAKLWMMYCHSYADESFNDWKNRVLGIDSKTGKAKVKDADLTEEGIKAIYAELFPA